MAITYVSTTDGGSNTTYAVNCGSGTDRFLKLYINGGNNVDNVTGVTYNSVAMTLQGKIQIPGAARFQYLYTLMNPSSGSNNIVITISAGDVPKSFASVYTGVVGTVTGATTASGNSTSASVTVSTVIDNSMVVGGSASSVGNASAGAGTTLNAGAAGVTVDADKTAVISPIGTGAVNVTYDTGTWAIIACAIAPTLLTASVSSTPVVSDAIAVGIGLSGLTDTSAISDSASVKIGFNNATKSTTTWSNQQKS